MRQIRSAANQMQPDGDWVASTRKTLLMQAKNALPSVPKPQKSVIPQTLRFFVPHISLQWMRAPAFAIFAVIVIVFGGSLYSVSAAEQSLPGDFLYSIKLATEQARMVLVNNPEDKVKLKTEFTERRVQEMKQVIANPTEDRPQRVTQAADILKRDMDTIKHQLDEVKEKSTPEKVKETVKMVDEKSKAVVKDLQESKSQLSTEEKLKVTEAQAAASDASVKAIEVLVETHGKAADVVTEEDVVEALKSHSDDVKLKIAESAEGRTPAKPAEAKQGAGADEADDDVADESESETATSTEDGTEAESSEADEAEVDAEAGTSTPAVQETDLVLQQIGEAEKSLDDASKFVEEKNLAEAVASIRVGTQKAYAAQKTVEEEVLANEALASSETTKQTDQTSSDGAEVDDDDASDESATTTTEDVTDEPMDTETVP